jgi:predicted PurR-regulated permease PerM
MALLLAVCTTPFTGWFVKKGAPGWLALGLTLAVDVVFIVALVWLIGQSVQQFSETLPQYEQRFEEIEQSIAGVVDRFGPTSETLVSDQTIASSGLISMAADFAAGIVSGFSSWGLIIMTGIFFLVEAMSMPRKLQNLKADSDSDVIQILELFGGLRQYMVVNAFAGVLAAVLNTILLFVMGIEFAVLWGVLSFFFSFVPNIGFLISVIPPAIMALLQFGVRETVIVVVAYIIINFVIDTVLKPKFIQEEVNISATVTFLSLIVWGWVLGPIGAILAVPMSIVIQAVLNNREETRWLAYLMGSGDEPYEPEPGAGPSAETDELTPSETT